MWLPLWLVISYICICTYVIVSIRERGGREAEIEERERWNKREHDRIMKSVNGAYVCVCVKYTCKLRLVLSNSI